MSKSDLVAALLVPIMDKVFASCSVHQTVAERGKAVAEFVNAFVAGLDVDSALDDPVVGPDS